MSYLSSLNKKQKQAVTAGNGPLLIVAGAGTGKTRVITNRIAYLIEEKGISPEQILAVTFTDKASQEMLERVDALLSKGYSDLWISTFHSFCERVLRDHGLDIGLATDFKLVDQTSAWLLLRQNLDRLQLDYYAPIGNPSKFLHVLIDHFSRCKDQAILPEDYLEYSRKTKEDKEELKEVALAYKTYQQLLLENNLLDFGDLLLYCLKLFKDRPKILEKYRQQFKYILVDEFQDTNWIQYQLMKLLAFPKNNLTVCSDDDQCFPAGTKISTPQGKKNIEQIRSQDKVIAAVGKGYLSFGTVKKIMKSKKKARLLTFVTETGKKLITTDNHKMFCLIPGKKFGKRYCYVYLMQRMNMGWRLGITDDLAQRLKLERSADRIVAVKACNSEQEARYWETVYSLRYGVPLYPFKPRKRMILTGLWLEKLFKEVNSISAAHRLANDLGINLESHHYCLGGVVRGRSERVKVILRMNVRRNRTHWARGRFLENPKVCHEVRLETSSNRTIDLLTGVGFNLLKVSKGRMLKKSFQTLEEAGKYANKLVKITGAIFEAKFDVGKREKAARQALIIPAGNVLPGMRIPVLKGHQIVYEQVIKRSEAFKTEMVYDLEVDKFHNFIANGVVVHNSIYKFRGASYGNILQFKKDFKRAKEIGLTDNYRSFQNILDLAHKFIQANNPNRLEFLSKISKKLKAAKKGKGQEAHLHFRTAEQEIQGVIEKMIEVMKKDKSVTFNNFAVLVRANNQAMGFARAFERSKIPYQFLALKGLYAKPVILDVISYFKFLDNYHESSAAFRILSLPFLEIPSQDIVNISQYSYKKSKSIFESLQELPLISGISRLSQEKIINILSLVRRHTEMAATKSVSEILLAFLENSGYLEYLVKKEKKDDLDFISQFHSRVKAFEESHLDARLKPFMDELNLELDSGEEGRLSFDPDSGPEVVKIMTVHSAKGLEFDYVFLVNLVDKRFPSLNRKDPIEIPQGLIRDILPKGDFHLEEERRLFYVAMTRAKKGLFLTSAEDYGGAQSKRLSRFLTELNYSGKITPLKNKSIRVRQRPRPEKVVLPERFSFTQLTAFEKCPLQYKFAHVIKIPVRGKAVFSFGKTMHNTLFQFFLEACSQKQSLERLLQIYQDQWLDEWYQDKNQRQKYFEAGKNSLEGFYQDYSKNNPRILYLKDKPALEQDFNLKIEGHTLIGKIDRIDVLEDGVEIIDYKTGSVKDRLAPEDKKQLLIYQLAAEEVLGLKPKKLTYYYLDENKTISFLGTEADKEKEKKDIVEEIERIKRSNFQPTPGWQCEWCDFKNICEHSKAKNGF